MNCFKALHIRYITILVAILSLCSGASGAEGRDSVVVSLLTCAPGPEVYELCGHEALRVRSDGIDAVWNYGTFDFAQPNFVYRFVKGETDYMLASLPFTWFMSEYVESGRTVWEQDLNLTQQEARRLLGMLRTEELPENRTYRYNYVLDNCATRITDRLEEATGKKITVPDSLSYGTFRKSMRYYHRDYPWYQFGIDLALGSGIDRPVTPREEMFAPPEMMKKMAGAKFADGRPVVSASRVLWQGTEDATLGPTPFWRTPLFLSLAFLLLAMAAAIWQIRRGSVLRPLYSVWFFLLGVAGTVIAFLVFVSQHEATSPNVLLFWLNPLQLIPAVAVWRRSWRKVMLWCMAADILLPLGMLAVWPFQAQSANVAVFPLMCSTIVLALSYIIIYLRKSYYNK